MKDGRTLRGREIFSSGCLFGVPAPEIFRISSPRLAERVYYLQGSTEAAFSALIALKARILRSLALSYRAFRLHHRNNDGFPLLISTVNRGLKTPFAPRAA